MPCLHIHIPFQKINEYRDFLRHYRFDLEIYFSSSVLDSTSPPDVTSILGALGYTPSLSIHGPFMDLSPGALDAKVRQATEHRFSAVLDIAEHIRPVSVVFHSGYEKWKYALDVDLWAEKSVQTWEPLNRRAEKMGVKIAIENIFEDSPGSLAVLMKRMDSENFGVCFDTGHFNLFSRIPLEDWMAELNPYIIELHIHDNNRLSDEHLPVGEGTFDFRRFFSLLADKDCIHTIEAHSPERVLRSIRSLTALTGT